MELDAVSVAGAEHDMWPGASTRPPGAYSPRARPGRRGVGSGGVAGMVRRAGSDAVRPCGLGAPTHWYQGAKLLLGSR